MVLYMIGLGLCDERDITVRGLEAVKKCDKVYLESYTSVLLVPKDRLEALYGREVIALDREACESDAKVDSMLDEASEGEVAFLVVGDVFGATTHSDLQLRAARRGIEVSVIHNSTVMTAVGACGLQLYRFGECVSIVFFTDTWRPDSFYDKIKANRSLGLHTLCLLDIRVKEPDMEALCRGKTGVYEPPRFMNVNTAIEELLEVEEKRGEGVYDASTMAVGLARVGCGARQQIVAGAMGELLKVDFGEPLHSLIICGHVTEFEQEMLELYGAAKRAGNE